MKNEKKELPLQIYINEAAARREKKALENLVEVIGQFSDELEKDEVLLDDKLLDQFVQNGTVAITNRLVENADSGKSMSMLMDHLYAGARRTATKYETFYRKIQAAIFKAGRPHTDIVMLNGRPSLRGNILEEIKQRNVVVVNNEQDLELYEKLTGLVSDFNDLRGYIKKNHPDAEDLVQQMIIALTEHHHEGDEITSIGSYLINKPNEARNDITLMVNPLFFG